MTYCNFAVSTDIDRETNYDDKFGKYIGNIFATTMEECFYCNPIHENEDFYFGVPLDNIMTLPQYLTAVLSTYTLSKGKHPKADLSAQFKTYEAKDRHYYVNDVREETIQGKRCFCYRNINTDVSQAIIWGAYFLTCIYAEIWDDEIPARDLLRQFLQAESCLNEEAFMEKHVLMQLHKQHFVPTMKRIVTEMCKNESDVVECSSNDHRKNDNEIQDAKDLMSDYKAEDIEWQLQIAKSIYKDDPKHLERVKIAREEYLAKREQHTLSIMKGADHDFLNDFFPMLICCPRQFMNSVTGDICHEPHRTVNRKIDEVLLTIGDFDEKQRLLTFNVAYGCCIFLVHLMKPEVKLRQSLVDQVCWNVFYYFNHDCKIVRDYNETAYRETMPQYYPINEVLAIFGTIHWLLYVQKFKSRNINLCLAWMEKQFCKKFLQWTEWKWQLSDEQKAEILSTDNIFHKLVRRPKVHKYQLTFDPWSDGRTYEDLKKFSWWRVTDFFEEDATLLLLQMCEKKSQQRLIQELEIRLQKEFCNERKRGLNEAYGIATEKRLWKSYGDEEISDEEFKVASEEEIDALVKQHLHFPDWWHKMAGHLVPVAHGLKDEEEEARKKRAEQNNCSIEAFCKHAQEEMEAKWPNPKRIIDNKVYTIESPEVLEYAKNLTPLQTEILRQLVANAGEIKTWQENPILNQYSEPEICEACCPLFIDSIILAFIDWGHVSALKIEDKGKLVLRKKNTLDKKPDFIIQKENVTLKVIEEESSEPTSAKKSLKPKSAKKSPTSKPAKQKSKKVTSIDEYPTFIYNYPDKSEQQKLYRTNRLIKFHKYLAQWKWIPKVTPVDDVYDLFTGTKSKNLIKWLCSKSSTSVLGYLFRQLVTKSIITISKDAEGVSMWDILTMHFVDSKDCPMDKDSLSKNPYREPKRQSEKIAILIDTLDPANTKLDVIENDDHEEILSFFQDYGLGKDEQAEMSNKSRSQLSGRNRRNAD